MSYEPKCKLHLKNLHCITVLEKLLPCLSTLPKSVHNNLLFTFLKIRLSYIMSVFLALLPQ